MKTLRFLLTTALVCLASTLASAQSEPPEGGLVGNWEITMPDGSPVVPGKTAVFEVTVTGDGELTGKTFLVANGKKTPVENETLEICALCGAPHNYHWSNPAKNTEGEIDWNSQTGYYDVSGPNGNRRLQPLD